MKKLFSLLTLAMLALSAMAANYVKVTSTDAITSGQYLIVYEEGNLAMNGGLTDKLDAVSNYIEVTIADGVIAADDDTNAAAFTYDAEATSLQGAGGLYMGQTTNANGLASNATTVYTNTLTIDEDGNADIVGSGGAYLRYNASSNQTRFRYYKSSTYTAQKAIQLYKLEEGGEPVITVAAPEFNPAACEFEESIEVALTAEEGATISYSTDGLAWNEYTQALTLTETTTVYAKATLNGVDSKVVSATYTKVEPTPEGTFIFPISEYVDSSSAAGEWTITQGGVTIACSNGLISNSAAYRIYKNATLTFTSTVGNITKIEIDGVSGNPVSNMTVDGGTLTTDGNNGTWTGSATQVVFTATAAQTRATEFRVYIDGEAPEVVAPVFDPASCVFTGSQVVNITCETEGATILYSLDGENYSEYTGALTLTETTTVYAKAQLGDAESTVASATYTKRAEVSTIAEANALDNKVDFVFYGEVVVTYQNGSNLWVRDATGSGLIYGNKVGTFNTGDVIAEEWDAQKNNFRGGLVPEFQYPNNVVASGETQEVAPYERETLTNDNVNEYVVLRGLEIIAETDTTVNNYAKYYYNAADSLVLYNQFGVEFTIKEGKKYDVVGTVTVYNEKPQLYIISVTEVEDQPAGLRGDVNDDENVNIADVTALIDYLLSGNAEGINLDNANCNGDEGVNIADVTALIDFLLSGNWAE